MELCRICERIYQASLGVSRNHKLKFFFITCIPAKFLYFNWESVLCNTLKEAICRFLVHLHLELRSQALILWWKGCAKEEGAQKETWIFWRHALWSCTADFTEWSRWPFLSVKRNRNIHTGTINHWSWSLPWRNSIKNKTKLKNKNVEVFVHLH